MAARSPLVAGEAFTEGTPNVRSPLAAVEALTGGVPNVRSPLAVGEIFAKGVPNVRSPLVVLEVFTLVETPPPYTTLETFTPSNIGFPVETTISFGTIQADHPTGRRYRQAAQPYPIYQFDLPFEGITSAGVYQALAASSLQYMRGFYTDRIGKYQPFLWQDTITPDYQVILGQIGLGDGATTRFVFCRALRNTYEPVGYVAPGDIAAVYINGTLQLTSAFAWSAPNLITFSAAPSSGAVVRATFNFSWVCNFADDAEDISEFFYTVAEIKSLKLQTVLSEASPKTLAYTAPTSPPDIFVPPALGWPFAVSVTPLTAVQAHSNARRYTMPTRQYPTYMITLTFEVLNSGAAYQGLAGNTLQYVKGFFIDQVGKYNGFLFRDTSTPDFQVTVGALGTGDGTTLNFTFCRALRETHEPVGYVFVADVSAVYVAGVLQATGWSVTAPNLLTFASAPAYGATITATFKWYYLATFAEDQAVFSQFAAQLFEVKELKLLTLPSDTAAGLVP